MMASLWFHMMDTDVYSTFASIEEAYYFVYKLFEYPEKYCTIIEKLQNQSIFLVGSDQYLQVSIYYGTSTPPIKNEWYPNGLSLVTKDQLKNHKEYIRRKHNYEIEKLKKQDSNVKRFGRMNLIRTKSYSSVMNDIFE
jgi:hypothetical protein